MEDNQFPIFNLIVLKILFLSFNELYTIVVSLLIRLNSNKPPFSERYS
jgi:hypothetical protein